MVDIIERNKGRAICSLRHLESICNDKRSEKQFIKDGIGQWRSIKSFYANRLSAYKKNQFDPFRRAGKRAERVVDLDLHDVPIRTTIGQANFFFSAFRCGLIDFVEHHTPVKD